MEIAEALALVVQLMNAATNGLALATQVSALIQNAQAQGRTTLTADELQQCAALDDTARNLLQSAIDKATAAT